MELAKNRNEMILKPSSKALITQLISKLQPQLLREKLRSRMQYWNDEQKLNYKKFVPEVKSTYANISSYSPEADRTTTKSNRTWHVTVDNGDDGNKRP